MCTSGVYNEVEWKEGRERATTTQTTKRSTVVQLLARMCTYSLMSVTDYSKVPKDCFSGVHNCAGKQILWHLQSLFSTSGDAAEVSSPVFSLSSKLLAVTLCQVLIRTITQRLWMNINTQLLWMNVNTYTGTLKTVT